MRGQAQLLVNTPEIELWPGGLLHARSNRDARALARARHVLRRKRDGRYLAADLPEGLLPLIPRSEEHTSELQSLMRISYAVFCLKKKKYKHTLDNTIIHIHY